jgi:CYTH domain-containing protein
MAAQREIERKYLVAPERLPQLSGGSNVAQGYLCTRPVVRVRTVEGPGGERSGFLTIKGEGLVDRDEFEYAIPWEEADALLALAHGIVIRKTRYRLPVEGAPDLVWELDVFHGENDGLIVAEVELPNADLAFPRPDWLGDEVSEDPAYKNACLSERPFKDW